MRINNPNGGGNGLEQSSGTSSVNRTNSSSGGSTSSTSKTGSDSVQLSGFAGQLSKTLEAGSSSRAQRVSELTQAVRSGSYQVDGAAVSRAMVDQALSSGSGGWVS